MINCNYSNTESTHKDIIDFVNAAKKRDPNFKVIDLGGGVNGWTSEIADMIVDINVSDTQLTLKADICQEKDYAKIISFVELHGLFDYCICTHTLEDLYNPFPALNYMPRIALAGVITMPTMTDELSPVQSLRWNGYIHHRWIFEFLDEKIFIIPKIRSLEVFIRSKMSSVKSTEIRFDWQGAIPYEIFMNNYLGPDLKTVSSELKMVLGRLNEQSRGVYTFCDVYTRPSRLLMRLVRFVRMKFGIKLDGS
jgi:hypothetical protein